MYTQTSMQKAQPHKYISTFNHFSGAPNAPSISNIEANYEDFHHVTHYEINI
jgi:hypothetical protein